MISLEASFKIMFLQYLLSKALKMSIGVPKTSKMRRPRAAETPVEMHFDEPISSQIIFFVAFSVCIQFISDMKFFHLIS